MRIYMYVPKPSTLDSLVCMFMYVHLYWPAYVYAYAYAYTCASIHVHLYVRPASITETVQHTHTTADNTKRA